MAEFCLDCWNKINETNDPAIKYIISKDLDLCEGCGPFKHVIVVERSFYWYRKLRFIIAPFKFIGILIYAIIKLPAFFVCLYKERKNKKDIH
ncbi:MAG: hypothetical protein IKL42_04350 [Clostridia bacterium]|nr:hypothetical protein [Clostridia bacterium]